MRFTESFLFRLLALACLPLYFGRDFTGGDSRQENNAQDQRTVNDLSQGGVQALGGSSVFQLTTDSGAVNAGREVAQTALIANADALRTTTSSLTTTSNNAINAIGQTANSFIDGSVENVREVLTSSRLNNQQLFGTIGDLLGFARDTLSGAETAQRLATTSVSDAYKTAKDSVDGNRTLILTGMTLVGVIGVTMFFRKG